VLLASLTLGCKKSDAPEPEAAAQEQVAQPAVESPPPSDPAKEQAKGDGDTPASTALVGKPAPGFSLPNLEGKDVSLSDFKGKIVVLEWFNPQCPFVKAAHTKGSLVDTAKTLTEKDVAYLAINSGAPGKQGHGVEINADGKKTFGLDHPILLDEEGKVGKAYGATNTPHIFVIDDEGTLAYAGAVDNSPDGEGASPEGGTLVNYLVDAVTALRADKPVAVSQTKAYGCSVKYAK
jgi:peroxiredoxin